MEESAICEGFENLRPGSDYDNLYHSALCRQRADWLVGLNGTRLFTVLYGGKVLKVGRVQTPYALTLQKAKKLLSGMFSFFNKSYLHQFQNVKAHRLYIR